MQDFTGVCWVDLNTCSAARCPKSSLHPPVHPHLVSLHVQLIGDSPPSSSSSARTRPPSPSAERLSALWMLSHRSTELHWGQEGNTLSSTEEQTVRAAFSFVTTTVLGISGANLKLVRERRTTCRVSMASLVNSACLLFLPVALLLSKYPKHLSNSA